MLGLVVFLAFPNYLGGFRMVKYCIHRNVICYQPSCSSLVNGVVVVCNLVPNKVGYFTPRKFVPVVRSSR